MRSLAYVPAFVRLAWQAGPGYTVVIVGARLARALVPIAAVWVAKVILDHVIGSTRDHVAWTPLWWYVALEMALVIAGEMLARVSAMAESLLGDCLTDDVSVRLMEHAAALDLEDFEDPVAHDHVERAVRQLNERVGPLSQLLTFAQDLVTLTGFSAVVVTHSLGLGLLLVIGVVPIFVGETYFSLLDYRFEFRNTQRRRLLAYLRSVAAGDGTAKEVRTLDLGPWLANRYRRGAEELRDQRAALAYRKNAVALVLSLGGVTGYYVAYVLVLLSALRGEISVGQLAMLAASFSRTRDLVQRVLLAAGEIQQKSLRLRDLFAFFEMRPRIDAGGGRPVRSPIREGLVFDDVSFRYAGSDRWALRHVSFHIDAGECVALVGENGAGKSTVVKLLARLYEPTEGRILLDGCDLREYDISSLRRSIAILFQDFVHYRFRFDENIGVGAVHHLEVEAWGETSDGVAAQAVPPDIRRASEQSLASAITARLPDGYRQVLGRFFSGGVDLSGGEWQRVALARAYMRVESADVVVLDEPTAALDARTDALMFERFRGLARNRTSILISHRFSTVRSADRIIVLVGGGISEVGTHTELMAGHSLYAELFDLQAAGYQ
jgi:ATP-binding cassette subfamily B protein